MATWYACGDDWNHAAATIQYAATPEGRALLWEGAVSLDYSDVLAFARSMRDKERGIVPIYLFAFESTTVDHVPTEPLESVL